MPAYPSSPPPEYLTTKTAAHLHDVSPATIRSWVRRGLLTPHTTIGTTTIYRTDDVDKAEMLARKRDRTGRANQRIT